MSKNASRRSFIKASGAAIAAGTMPYWFTSQSARANAFRSALERPVVGCIGTGDRWKAVVGQVFPIGDVAAICDVDAGHLAFSKDMVEKKQNTGGNNKAIDTAEDYRKILDRKDIDIITCVTPDHWHTKVSIEAMKAGKDVYCEKPLTLTINEGKQICKVLTDTNRVFQVGTQQRTEMGQKFLNAIAMIRDGRIGKVQTVTAAIGGVNPSPELPVVPVPQGLNWEMWLGQTPKVDYRSGPAVEKGFPKSRCHYEFRWWYEYSGGKLTDWGAHHVDISLWGMDKNGEGQGPSKIEVLSVKHPVEFKDGWPVRDDMYNVATAFEIKCTFADGMVLNIVDNAKTLGFGNGIMFEGEKGKIFVSRSELKGSAVDELKDKPLPEGAIEKLYGGPIPKTHMQNFFDSVVSRKQPVSDVYTHVRAMNVCHLANIAARFNRTLNWDPVKEEITGDAQANAFCSREQRKGYEINV